MIRAANNDIIVVERTTPPQITVLWDDDRNGESDPSERARLATAPGINHGVAFSGNYLYASSPTTVYRWRYVAGQRSDLGAAQTVITNVPCCGHTTRTIAFDQNGLLYLSVGSRQNVDPDSTHARIFRFDVSSVPNGGIPWSRGEMFADGLRNEVALTMDPVSKIMWGSENGMDNAFRADLGGSIVRDNPSEELNKFDVPGLHYGYPQCFSSYVLDNFPDVEAGTQYVDNNFRDSFTDAWCRNVANNKPPALNFPAHMAPLDMIFWSTTTTNWPAENIAQLFVTFHGSWNRTPAQGYRVDRVMFNANRDAVDHTPFLARSGSAATGPGWLRPVSVAMVDCVLGGPNSKCLAVTSDTTGHIVFVGYTPLSN